MTSLPNRSPGILLAPLGTRFVAYDLVTEMVHHLNHSAGIILGACDGDTDRIQAIDSWATATGADPALIAEDLDTVLEDFSDLGLVGRTTTPDMPAPLTVSTDTGTGTGTDGDTDHGRSMLSATHRILQRVLAFRSADPQLLEAVDSFLGTGRPEPSEPGLLFDLEPLPDDRIRLRADEEWVFANRSALLDQLVAILNHHAVASHDSLVLHAGGVRTPDGRILVLPAESGSGKSTLTAALVRAGCDYLGDEAIGIDPAGVAIGYPKRLAIDANSRSAVSLPEDDARDIAPTELRADVERLAGPVGPVTHVVFPIFQPDTALHAEPLDVVATFDTLLTNTLNLARIGEPGLETLCHLATTVTAARLTHGDAVSAADHLIRSDVADQSEA